MTRIAIVGGGITGLAAAYELERSGDAEIILYEAADHLGGKLRTKRVGEYLVEEGPDCFFARKPGVVEFIRELGIGEELIEPQAREFSILVAGRLHRVPRGLTNLQCPNPDDVRAATFLTEDAKRRALAPALVTVENDISVRRFFSQRFGPEFSRLVAEPLLAGTHGGDPERLSMRALYPGYLNPHVGGPVEEGPTFLSFRNGMQTLVDGVAKSLTRTQIHLGAPLQALPSADRVLLAVPAPSAVPFLPANAAALVASIPHRPARVVTQAFSHSQPLSPAARHERPVTLTKEGKPGERENGWRESPQSGAPPEDEIFGTGFLVPPGEPSPYTGATWSSRKWAGRAPDGGFLMRLFMNCDDDLAHRPWFDASTVPLWTSEQCWASALPQYELGHLDLLARIDEAMAQLPHVFLAGAGYRGVGIPDCLRQGREAARRIVQSL